MYKYAFNNTGVSIKKFKGSYGRQKELTTKDTKVNIKVWQQMNLVHWGRTRSLPQRLLIDSSSTLRTAQGRLGNAKVNMQQGGRRRCLPPCFIQQNRFCRNFIFVFLFD